MKRRTLIEYDDASPEVQAIYDEIMNTMGSPAVLNFLKALGNNQHVLRGVWCLLRETVIEGEIPALLKQLILFKISIIAGNEYCTALHGHAALNLDPTLTYEHLVSLEDQLRDEGFSDSEIDELLAVGFFSVMMNMMTDTYDVPRESPFPP
jgi:alkylhydroperoxidase family enzyme